MIAQYLTQHKIMTKIVVIDRSGELKTVAAKDISAATLYKRAGLKSGEGFVLRHTWGQDDGLDQQIELYAKTSGKAGQENKYDFPPPVDETLFFGPCVLIGKDPATGQAVDLDEEDWEGIYEFLFGGFEDLGSEDSDSDEELDTDDELEAIAKSTGQVIAQTKQGYAKDGFIVDDEEEDEDYDETESESDESTESEQTPPPKRVTKSRTATKSTTAATAAAVSATTKPKSTKKSKPAKPSVPDSSVEIAEPQLEEYCESELSEESYVA